MHIIDARCFTGSEIVPTLINQHHFSGNEFPVNFRMATDMAVDKGIIILFYNIFPQKFAVVLILACPFPEFFSSSIFKSLNSLNRFNATCLQTTINVANIYAISEDL